MPGPSSSDLDGDAVVACGVRAPRPVPPRRRVAHRVLEQVGDDLVHPLGIAVGGEIGRVDRRPTTAISGACSCCSRTACVEQRLDPELGALERHRARLEAREVEQLLDQPAEALDLREHRAEGLGIGVG